MSKSLKSTLFKLTLEFLPILLFIFVYHVKGFILATFLMVFALLLGVLIEFKVEKVIPKFSLAVTSITLLFATLSIYFKNPKIFIFRDTFYDAFFFFYLIHGFFVGKPGLERLFGHVISLNKNIWEKLSFIWMIYFFVVGSINEILRRTSTVSHWVSFKTFVIFVTLIVFLYSVAIVKVYQKRQK